MIDRKTGRQIEMGIFEAGFGFVAWAGLGLVLLLKIQMCPITSM